MTHSTAIDKVYVINLESRPDRRREMHTELERISFPVDSAIVEFFKAIAPESAGSFPSVGARGCFLSHLGVLKQARSAQQRTILILEDDATCTRENGARLSGAVADLDGVEWSIAYLGHRISHAETTEAWERHSDHWCRLPPATGVETTHAMLIHQRTFDPLIAYLERMMERPAGHADGGPMHVDGAYSWFRRNHPDMVTLVTPVPYVTQRASKSDIASASWKERLPLIGVLRRVRNRILR